MKLPTRIPASNEDEGNTLNKAAMKWLVKRRIKAQASRQVGR